MAQKQNHRPKDAANEQTAEKCKAFYSTALHDARKVAAQAIWGQTDDVIALNHCDDATRIAVRKATNFGAELVARLAADACEEACRNRLSRGAY